MSNEAILIIGGGTWGCSTALQLARNGYTDVTVFDQSPIPSPISAGNDVNKIMEEGISNIVYWRDRQLANTTAHRLALGIGL